MLLELGLFTNTSIYIIFSTLQLGTHSCIFWYDDQTKENNMTADDLQALKVAFSYMPQAIEVNKYEYGDDFQRILDHIEFVRATLLEHGIDPDEVSGDINPDSTPNSCY